MTSIWRSLKVADEKAGQSLVEYSLILCLVVVVLIVVVMLLGNQVQNLYCNISGGLAH
jgi:Flp pilus assembly pilin Flp